jgi:hypothetical protein
MRRQPGDPETQAAGVATLLPHRIDSGSFAPEEIHRRDQDDEYNSKISISEFPPSPPTEIAFHPSATTSAYEVRIKVVGSDARLQLKYAGGCVA